MTEARSTILGNAGCVAISRARRAAARVWALWLVASLAGACNAADDPEGPATGGTGGQAGTSGSAGSAGTAGSGGRAGSGGGCALATKPGTTVVVDCATKVTVNDAGNGFRPPAPAGSECDGERTYSLSLTSGELTWSVCMTTGTAPWQLEQGNRTLSAQELADARTDLQAIKVWSGMMACGADKPTYTIEVDTPSGSQIYTDSFYACNPVGAPFVDNIDAGFSALSDLAMP